MTIGKLVRSEKSFKLLLKTKLPVTVSYRIGVLREEINKILTPYNEARNKLIKELGEEIPGSAEAGNLQFNIRPEKQEKYINELSKLEEEKVKINIPEIKIKDLGNISIEPSIFVDLNWLIKE